MGGSRTEIRLRDYNRATYVAAAKALGAPAAQVGKIGICYDYATYAANRAESDVKRALEWWLRAPAQQPISWHAFTPQDFPANPIGVLLQAASARLRMMTGYHVHQSFLAALAGISQRALRAYIDSGELVSVDPTARHHDWLTPQSARDWMDKRRAAPPQGVP